MLTQLCNLDPFAHNFYTVKIANVVSTEINFFSNLKLLFCAEITSFERKPNTVVLMFIK